MSPPSGSGVCTRVYMLEVAAGGRELAVFQSAIVLLAGVSVVFLLLVGRRASQRLPAVYSHFLLATTFTLAAVAVLYALANPTVSDGDSSSSSSSSSGNNNKKEEEHDKAAPSWLLDGVYVATLAAQWWIQLAVVVVLFMRGMDGRSLRRAALVTSALTLVLTAAPAVALAVACRACGIVFTEVLLTVGFAVVAAADQLLPRRSRPRPAARAWALFQGIAHALFLSEEILLLTMPATEPARCLVVAADLVYFALYAPVLWHTLHADAKYWRQHGALHAATGHAGAGSSDDILGDATPLLYSGGIGSSGDTRTSADGDSAAAAAAAGSSRRRLIEDVPRVKYDHVVVERLVGTGAFADVYKASYRGETVALKQLKLPMASDARARQKVIDSLLRETLLLARFQHENVLRLIGVVADPDRLCILTEYAARGSLFDIIHAITGNYGAGAHASRVLEEERERGDTTGTGGDEGEGVRAAEEEGGGGLLAAGEVFDANSRPAGGLRGDGFGEDMRSSISSAAAAAGASGGGAMASTTATVGSSSGGGATGSDAKGVSAQVLSSRELRATWQRRLEIMRDAAQGLAYLHRQTPKAIHRDVKSHNLLLTSSWKAVVADFGLSRTKETTQTMTTLGTPQWMAPEVLRGERYNEACDVYSFAVVCWELACMRAPWANVIPAQVILRVSLQDKRLPVPDYVPRPVARLIRLGWDPDPDMRPPMDECAEFCAELVAMAERGEMPPPPTAQLGLDG